MKYTFLETPIEREFEMIFLSTIGKFYMKFFSCRQEIIFSAMEFHKNIHRDDIEIPWKWHRYFMEIPYTNSLEFAIVIQ